MTNDIGRQVKMPVDVEMLRGWQRQRLELVASGLRSVREDINGCSLVGDMFGSLTFRLLHLALTWVVERRCGQK